MATSAGPAGTGPAGTGPAGTGSAGTGSAGTGPASTVPASAVPASIRAAWGVREQPRKGPKPALTLPRIVAAAVQVADADGLDAVSMGRVATELGTAPMSLYRHVANKEQLLDLMVDAAWGPAPEPDSTEPGSTEPDSTGPDSTGPDSTEPDGAPGGWRAGLSRWAWALRTGARQHPWVVRIPVRSLPIMPNEVAWFENALVCMDGTGFSEARKASVIMLLAGYVRNLATTEADVFAAMQASGQSPSEWMSSYAGMLRELATPDRFPALTRFIESGVFDIADGPDDEFIFGLERILDGVEALMVVPGTP
jgi:AcrR family transcriptional regulator